MNNYRKLLRVAFLGGSSNSAVGRAHVTALRLLPYFHLVGGLFSRNEVKNKKTLYDFNLPLSPTLKSIDDFIGWVSKEQIDLVVLLTPTDQHFTHLLLLSNLGIPVISEKALATSNQQAQEIVDRYKQSNCKNFVMYNYTSYPMVREMRAILNNWGKGCLKFVKLEMPQDSFIKVGNDGKFLLPQEWRRKDYAIPTITLDLGVHLHSLTSFLFEQELEVEGAFVRESSLGKVSGVIDDVSISTFLQSGVPVDFWYSKVALGYKNGLKISVFGERESLSWLQERPDQLLVSDSCGKLTIIRRGDFGLLEANAERYSRFKGGHPTGFIEAMSNYYEDIALNLLSLSTESFLSDRNLFTFQDAQIGLGFFEKSRLVVRS